MDGRRKMRGSCRATGILSAIVVGLLALLAAGCGGGGGDPTAGGTGASGEAPLSKAVFIKKGDAICAAVPGEFQKRLTGLEKRQEAAKKPKPSFAKVAEVATLPPLEKAVRALEALPPPEGEELQAQTIVKALENAIASLEENPTGELAGPKSPFAEFQRLTRQYGFKTCSQL